MEGVVIQVIGGIATIIAGYAVLRKTVAEHEEQLKEIKTVHTKSMDDIERRVNAQFKRIDDVGNRTTVLEQSTKEHLGLREAEDRFVSHKELQLHLNNIESSIRHIENGQIEMKQDMGKKLDYLIEMQSTKLQSVIRGGNNA